MAVNPSFSGALSGLARALVQHGRLQQGIAKELSVQARNNATGFIEQLVAKGRMSTLELAEFASQIFGLPLLDLDALDTAALPLDVVDKKFMRERRVLLTPMFPLLSALVDRRVRAFRLAGAAVDALLGDHRRHGVSNLSKGSPHDNLRQQAVAESVPCSTLAATRRARSR